MINSCLKPQLKNFWNAGQVLPEKLIYHSKIRYVNTNLVADDFFMFSTKKNDKNFAEMVCYPKKIKRGDLGQVPSLYIKKLCASGNGYGSAMLDFARVHSKNVGCNGNLHLISSGYFKPNRVPHIFYKKYGMNSDNAIVNKKLDKFINVGESATYHDFKDICMYYPPIKFQKLSDKFLNFIKSFGQ